MRLLLTFKIFVVVVSAWVTVANQQSSQHQQELRDLAAGAKPRKQKVQENPQHQKMTREGSGKPQQSVTEKLHIRVNLSFRILQDKLKSKSRRSFRSQIYMESQHQRGNRSKKERVQAQAGPNKKTKTNPRNRMLLDN